MLLPLLTNNSSPKFFVNKMDYDEKQLAFDLRLKYADIVGRHLEDIAIYRKERNFKEWFNAMEDLFNVIKHKLKFKKFKGRVKYYFTSEMFEDIVLEDYTDFELYKTIRKGVINIINRYTEVYSGTSNDTKGFNLLCLSFQELEQYLYYLMDAGNVFGSKYDEDDGL